MIIINIRLDPSGFHTQVFPWSWPARNKGCVRPHSLCFIPVFACGERRKASMATGSWSGTNAVLLGVFQVTLFCPVRAEQPIFDRTPVSRDIDCYSLAKISEILVGADILSTPIFVTFSAWWAGTNKPVQFGKESAHKSRAPTFCWRLDFVNANILSTPRFCHRLDSVNT